jgi:glycosyltransferase involved in cell wall biosynthesis
MKPLMKPKALLIEACDFEAFPVGGQLAYVKHLVATLGNRFALVGVCTGDTEQGRWIEREVLGQRFYFFGIGKRNPKAAKPLVPRRLSAFIDLKRHERAIMSLGVRSAYLQAPETLLAVRGWKLDHICYHFHGVENPLSMPRYRFGRLLAGSFEKALFRAIKDRVERVLVSADNKSIDVLIKRGEGLLDGAQITWFPTRVDTRIFRPDPDLRSCSPVGVDKRPVFVTCGRVNSVKGWDFLIEAFKHVSDKIPGAQLYFVGDGEDAPKLKNMADAFGLERSVHVTGFQDQKSVAAYLNAGDVFVMGSHREGWSVAMLEALACGLPMVTTNVSGAEELIVTGKNGFIVNERTPAIFAQRMLDAWRLPYPNNVSVEVAARFALDRLAEDLSNSWPALASGA